MHPKLRLKAGRLLVELISLENQKRINDKLRKIQGTRRLIDSNSKKTKSLIPKCQKKKVHMDLLNIYKMQPIRVYFWNRTQPNNLGTGNIDLVLKIEIKFQTYKKSKPASAYEKPIPFTPPFPFHTSCSGTSWHHSRLQYIHEKNAEGCYILSFWLWKWRKPLPCSLSPPWGFRSVFRLASKSHLKRDCEPNGRGA